MSEDKLTRLSRIFSFEKKLREAKNMFELRYIITNELRTISPYVFAFFCIGSFLKISVIVFRGEAEAQVSWRPTGAPVVAALHSRSAGRRCTLIIFNPARPAVAVL